MGRKSKAKFKLKGHTVPGINQKSETTNNKDGRSPSSAFQMESPMKVEDIGLKGAKIDPMSSYEYKETSKSNLPSFRDIFSLEQQQEAMKKWRDKRAAKKQKKIDDQKLKEEEEIGREQEMLDKTQGNIESMEKEFETIAQEDQRETLESNLKPVELEMMDLPEERESYTQEDLKDLPQGSEERKQAYDDLGWGYDETIGSEYAKDESKTTSTDAAKLKEAQSTIKETNLKLLNDLLKNPNITEEQRKKIQEQIN